MRDIYRLRRSIVMAGLQDITGLKVNEPQGTFYAFPDVSHWLAQHPQIDTVERLCDWLLDEHGLALVPGSAFGDDRCVRLSFAASEADLTSGLARLVAALG
jgi:aspartate aminotransferase